MSRGFQFTATGKTGIQSASMTKHPRVASRKFFIQPLSLLVAAIIFSCAIFTTSASAQSKDGYFEGPEVFHLFRETAEEQKVLRDFIRESWQSERKSRISQVHNIIEGCLVRGYYTIEKRKGSLIVQHEWTPLRHWMPCTYKKSKERRTYDRLEEITTADGPRIKLTNSKTKDSRVM